MIDVTRLTKSERSVLSSAVAHYVLSLDRRVERAPDDDTRNDAKWRLFEAQRLMLELSFK